MKINDIEFNADLWDILTELQSQLRINGIDLLGDMKQSGHNIMLCCPYHNERRPSAGVDMRTGMFHCFACQEVRTLEELIAHCFGHGDDMKFGWNWLLKNFLTISVEERKDIPLDLERNTLYNVTTSYISEEELDTYRYTHPYMYQRGLTDEVIELFDIGYDSNSSCITFPVRDVSGNTLFVARRSVKTKYFNYPKDAVKPLYGLYELYQLDKFPEDIYICESMLDALSIWCYDRYAVALNGLGNELSIKQIRQLPCRHIILATDKDDAGKNARIRLRQKLNNKMITELDYSTYPDGAKDINDMSKDEFYNLKEIF